MKNKDPNIHTHWAEKTKHTRLKHLILEYYLKEWAEILANASYFNRQEDIYYIDGFAGRGIFLDGDKGSPLIAAVQNILGNFKDESKKLIESNKKIQTDAACFWFVDPFWWARDFTFDDVIGLMFDQGKPRLRKEVLINFTFFQIRDSHLAHKILLL